MTFWNYLYTYIYVCIFSSTIQLKGFVEKASLNDLCDKRERLKSM